MKRKIAQTPSESQVQGPDVQIDPSIQSKIQDAVNELRKADPNVFKGVSKIVGISSSNFGQVSSEDPTVIHINLSKIENQVKNDLGSSSDPEALKEAIKRALVETISHEAAHTHDFDEETHKFPGGEGVAESKENEIMRKLNYDKPISSKVDATIRRALRKLAQANVGGQTTSPSGKSETNVEYGVTGNDLPAGGPSAFPLETRNEKLYNAIKKYKQRSKDLGKIASAEIFETEVDVYFLSSYPTFLKNPRQAVDLKNYSFSKAVIKWDAQFDFRRWGIDGVHISVPDQVISIVAENEDEGTKDPVEVQLKDVVVNLDDISGVHFVITPKSVDFHDKKWFVNF